MKGDIVKGPKGLVTCAKFFEQLKDLDREVHPDGAMKDLYIQRLKALDPGIAPHYGVVEDWLDSAEVKGARMLRDARFLVQYEVYSRGCYGGWDGPYQMPVIWNPDGTPGAYTIYHTAGRPAQIGVMMYTFDGARSEYTDDLEKGLRFMLRMKPDDALLVGNDDCNNEFVTVTAEDGGFVLSWQELSSPYSFNSVKPNTWQKVFFAVRMFKRKGMAEFQKWCEWEISDAYYDEATGLTTVEVPLVLRRDLARAIRGGERPVIDAIKACGITEEGDLPEFEIKCKFGDEREIHQRLRAQLPELRNSSPIQARMVELLLKYHCPR